MIRKEKEIIFHYSLAVKASKRRQKKWYNG